MTRTLLLLLVVLALLAPTGYSQDPGAAKEFDQSHAEWTAVLKTHSRGMGLDYGSLLKKRAGLDQYTTSLEQVSAAQFKKWSRDERFAFWINAYNAYTIQLIIDHYPLASIRDIGDKERDAWHQVFIPLGHLHAGTQDKQISLDDIEHKILRPQFKDARVHAAVNCASIGCPPLAKSAFTGRELEEQLTAQTRAWLANTAQNRFDAKEKTAHVSKLFEWFGDDFKKDAGSLAKWLAKYAPRQHAGWLAEGAIKIQFQDYDWKLNDVPKPVSAGR